MPTFRAVVLKHHLKSHKSNQGGKIANIKIRITHNRKVRYIDTGLTVTTEDLTKKLEIKTPAFIDATNSLIASYRQKCNMRAEAMKMMSIEKVVSLLTESQTEEIDFIHFALNEIERIKKAGNRGVAANYQTAINSLIRFAGNTLNVKDINSALLQEFEAFIRKRPDNKKNSKGMVRAPSLYMSCIRAIHNRLKSHYNNEDIGLIRVPSSPFSKYKVPKEQATRKRAIDAEIIKAIMNLSDKDGAVRCNLAKDCFILSFCLIGMNSTDLYNCSKYKNGYITYNRMKTFTRRTDKAEISVAVQPEIKELIRKYKDKTGKRVFNFYQLYSSEGNFNQALNKGLKQLDIGMDDLQFYAARHSWATIALNKVKIDKYTVHTALNHVDEAMKVTDIYLEKDWSMINDANRKVLDYVVKGYILDGVVNYI